MTRLPNASHRIVTVGRTGTGKTVAGLWHLANHNLQARPWLIVDFKGDDHIAEIEDAQEIDYDFKFKKKDRGLFILRPSPGDVKRVRIGGELKAGPLESYLWSMHQRGNTGIFCDESFMMGQDNDAFNTIITQGRSLKMPMILCTQRPVWVSRFAFSEADFVQVFHLNDNRDKATIRGFIPIDYENERVLKPHQSWYYDVGQNRLDLWNPVPPIDDTLARFHEALGRKRRYL